MSVAPIFVHEFFASPEATTAWLRRGQEPLQMCWLCGKQTARVHRLHPKSRCQAARQWLLKSNRVFYAQCCGNLAPLLPPIKMVLCKTELSGVCHPVLMVAAMGTEVFLENINDAFVRKNMIPPWVFRPWADPHVYGSMQGTTEAMRDAWWKFRSELSETEFATYLTRWETPAEWREAVAAPNSPWNLGEYNYKRVDIETGWIESRDPGVSLN